MKKLFATDLDGTLFNVLHATDFIILKGIRKILKRGDCFAIATGRNMRVEHIIHDFKDLDVHCIAMNGAMILDPQKNIIYERGIDKEIIADLFDSFPEIGFEFIGREHVYVTFDKESLKDQMDQRNLMVRLIYRRFKKLYTSEYIYNCDRDKILSQDILKVNCKIRDPQTKQRFNDYLKKHQDQIINAPFAEMTYELTAAGVNKAEAIRHLAKILKIRDKDVYVYGDGDNDIEMLKMFENSYAPKNACDNARKAAGQIIGNNNRYSVIRHMIRQ